MAGDARRLMRRLGAAALLLGGAAGAAAAQRPAERELFRTSDGCIACHNALRTASGEDVSIGAQWRASMMANAARDPYWQAAVRREVLDHPEARAAIEDKCATCHMPMARFERMAAGGRSGVFEHLPAGAVATRAGALAADGVSCTVCHQIQPDGLGEPRSFDGRFVVDTLRRRGEREVFGPYQMDRGRTRIMHSASEFIPTEARHLQRSETCAACHTLFTEALGPGGAVIGTLPEQTPYLEWRASALGRRGQSCQSCHLPQLGDSTAITGVLGQPRARMARHGMEGGNVFMLRMLRRYRTELGVKALPGELDDAVARTERNLGTAARIELAGARVRPGRLDLSVTVSNLTGHKLPTAYPSRRVWIHLTVRDRAGAPVFESGAIAPDGSIAGNDNDADATGVEPHYRTIARADQVQIYESVMVDREGQVTTGLLRGVRYVKDNRILPAGFDAGAGGPDIAVRGDAAEDADFTGGTDRVTYTIETGAAAGPFTIEAELRFQSIAFRWARNLAGYDAPEIARFVAYYSALADSSSAVLARGTLTSP